MSTVRTTPPVTPATSEVTAVGRRPGLLRTVLADRRSWIAIPPLLAVVALAIWPDAFDGPGIRPCLLAVSLEPPSAAHLFGTDLQGCDLWASTVHGTRNSVLVGVGSVALAGVVGTFLGIASGLSRRADAVVRVVVDLFLSLPILLLGLVLLTVTDTRGPEHVMLVLAFLGWPLMARIMRTEVQRVAVREYVTAARALGGGRWHVLRRHVAPNAIGAVLVVGVLSLATMITTEAIITFLGAGLQLPDTSWGIVLQEAGRRVSQGMHLVLPGTFLVVTVGALVLLAEVVREARPPA